MSAITRWLIRSSAAVVIVGFAAAPTPAQVVVPKRAPQPVGERPKTVTSPRMPPAPPSTPVAPKSSIVGMPAFNGGSSLPAQLPQTIYTTRWVSPLDSPWQNAFLVPRSPAVVNSINPYALYPSWEEPPVANLGPRNRAVRNPFVVNHLLMNPLMLNRPFLDPFNGPGLIVGGMGVPIRPVRGDAAFLAAARRPGSMLDQQPEFAMNPLATMTYQPISGIVTLADGSTFYRGTGAAAATELGNYSTGGGLDASLLSGTFFSPSLGSVGDLGRGVAFLPYVW